MARPTARVLALLELLQAGGTHTVADLAERLEVDKRTVRRYVEHLRELDIPVDAVRGRYGGYRLARHYRMPPLMLTDEEALAVVWALLFDRHSEAGPASSLAVDNAMAKVRRVLPDSLARRIDAVLQTVDFTGVRSVSGRDHATANQSGNRDGRTLLDLAEAARDRRLVAFDYQPRQGRWAQRQVQSHGVVAHRGLLYLTGFDVDRQGLRTFRLDRMAGLQVRSVTFAAPADVDPVAQVVGPLTAAPWRHDVSVLINADMAYVQTRIPDTLASVTPAADATRGDGWLRVFLRAEHLEWVAGTLAALDRPFVIEQPPELHDVVRELGRRLIEGAVDRSDHR
ncbi:helix-turn-helix transcriptional regulator [Cryptosporangium phraense]|uniref:WYL domain-containing protein n=1 Tax=Cryptosporangium phraense TaxID=2593070 RepID=A0A545AX34_9ACTN|nr:WYL domain-containing protein [Cryptosporangium phraense]TQS45893.1 WYL domain-containing protein [Cryptosporangium phraense]